MNFHEWLYFLENATVSQTLKGGKPLDKAAASIILNQIKSGLQQQFGTQEWIRNPKFFDNYTKWLTYWYIQHVLVATPMWTQIQAQFNSKESRVAAGGQRTDWSYEKAIADLINSHSVAYTPPRYAQQRTNDVRDYLAYAWRDPNLISQLNNTAFTPEHIEQASEEWHEMLAAKESEKGADDGTPIIKLDKLGARWKGWQWIHLDRNSCDAEANAMGHCGNAGGHEDDRILSLRDEENFVHLTFIVRNGALGEMKGRGNTKPSKTYHGPIMELLKSKYINTIIGGGYKPENNFSFDDLEKTQQEILERKKPYINKPFEYATEKGGPKEALDYITDIFDYSFEKVYKEDNTNEYMVLCSTHKNLESLQNELQNSEEETVEDFSWIDKDEQFYGDWWPSSGWYDEQYGLEHTVDRKSDEMIEKLMDLRWPMYLDYIDAENEDEAEEMWEDMPWSEKLEIDEEAMENHDDGDTDGKIKDHIDRAYEVAYRDGTLDAAWKSIEDAFNGRGTWFEVEIHRHDKYYLKIPMKSLKDLYYSKFKDDTDYYQVSFERLFDLSWSAPYNGFEEFNDEYFNSSLQEELGWHLKDAEKKAKESSPEENST